jgi:hypothetical protein
MVVTQLLPAPGGCTIAGLLALEDGRVRSTIAKGIPIATERASKLGQPVGTTDDEVNAVQRGYHFANLSKVFCEKCTTLSVYLIHGTYRRAEF